uniref:Glucose-6-phosphate 1-dehydrogenase n=1 Tax=Spongospora subterranea TaxID=70186 RepID=A0A0H5R5S4_9EUKA|eukprot:CRZ09505.1 hypothetical protein [Spongospora subterranea]
MPESPSPVTDKVSFPSLDELFQENQRLQQENDQLKQALYSQSKQTSSFAQHEEGSSPDSCLTVIVLGASGDLAKKKTFPALFALYKSQLLPKKVNIIGYARSHMSTDQFRQRVHHQKYSKEEQQAFIDRCIYFTGAYDSDEAFSELNALCNKLETGCSKANRLFYLAIPPTVFLASARGIRQHAMSQTGWNRVVVEKPFGSDFATAALMGSSLMRHFNEEHIYRIDHYLGKEMVQNLSVLRFANSIFEPIWNGRHIQLVTITFKESIGTAGRGGYFDQFGIIRDVMQNHLIQILSLVAMEQPASLNASDVSDEKVKVLRCIAPATKDQIVIGQYSASSDGSSPGYLDDKGVPDTSLTPTYALAVLFIKNSRWDGVPFILKCGKGLDSSKAEIRIQFRRPPGDLYGGISGTVSPSPNELVIRVQPDEAIYLKLMTKQPGLAGDEKLHQTELDLTYKKRFEHIKAGLPDAYERLILDVVRGDHSLFVRNDELLASWAIFTPILHRLEQEKVKPIIYAFGSRGPKEADMLAAKMGFQRNPEYSYRLA